MSALAVLLLVCLWAGSSAAPACAQSPPSEPLPPQSNSPQSASPQPAVSESAAGQPDWISTYLADDPLAAQDSVTLQELQQALDDPLQQAHVIERHFFRLREATPEQKLEFLKAALQHTAPVVQRQAAVELHQSGQLEAVVVQQLQAWLQSNDPQRKAACIIALSQMDFDPGSMPEEYWQSLLEALGSEDPELQSAAAAQLLAQGPAAVPRLLQALQSPEPRLNRSAAQLLSRIVGSRGPSAAAPGMPMAPAMAPPGFPPGAVGRAEPGTVTPPKAAPAGPVTHTARREEPQAPATVRVYYGTNRELLRPDPPSWGNLLFYPSLFGTLLLAAFVIWRRPSEAVQRSGCFAATISVLVLAVGLWSLLKFRVELSQMFRLGTGVQYGMRRDAGQQVHYGYCDVSIPPTHVTGEVESPLFGPEDENVHVVLQTTETLEEQAFFDTVRAEIAQRDPDAHSCFVFIHGFNVSFESAARRTAQIHYDLNFPGAPIFFSWPSRNSVRHYFSDRNEIGFSQYVIQQFLLDVAQRVDAQRIHVIAHSMGADATCRAIAELGDRGRIFDQIILAAPDIDREVFRLQLAPRLSRTASRTTMYCSRNDWALQVSNAFNDGPRAGDSSHGILTTHGVDTVDASGIDTDLLGHSYYGDCLPILRDVRTLVTSNLPPENRELVPWPVSEEFRYWTFAEGSPPPLRSDAAAESSSDASVPHAGAASSAPLPQAPPGAVPPDDAAQAVPEL